MIYSKTLQIVYRVKNKSLPDGIRQLFLLKEGHYNLRALFILGLRKVRTNLDPDVLVFVEYSETVLVRKRNHLAGF